MLQTQYRINPDFEPLFEVALGGLLSGLVFAVLVAVWRHRNVEIRLPKLPRRSIIASLLVLLLLGTIGYQVFTHEPKEYHLVIYRSSGADGAMYRGDARKIRRSERGIRFEGRKIYGFWPESRKDDEWKDYVFQGRALVIQQEER